MSGEPLFVSTDKFNLDADTFVFTRPISEEHGLFMRLITFGMERVEVKQGCKFSSGTRISGWTSRRWGMRYCINSVVLKFIPVEDMLEAGYGDLRLNFVK